MIKVALSRIALPKLCCIKKISREPRRDKPKGFEVETEPNVLTIVCLLVTCNLPCLSFAFCPVFCFAFLLCLFALPFCFAFCFTFCFA
ncbi:MAG: hypothetical protein J3R72DRAFT_75601 [Linnemannia gamsii]|nr:MAG: hypothetical protein J3R72DRAFT_75601 [Linnemannia gamsii]